ncbi:potassium transporter [Saccharophagus sp. K07]|jgi:trk system potassium uptake protein TrkH|uniref:TrkH family potassium uptake protein n=1 Tax=Saccharophagus sp. K07 TaxID=2283636 RepID=UPI001651FEF9|nr:TrkH family potassium uptake protein [Saccharophagus sp. K07]MBC6906161.1 potassium transporter [Saccharophagus sp. K07]
MRPAIICKVLGVLLMMFSLTLLPPIGVALWYQEGSHWTFLFAFAITLITGLSAWYPLHDIHKELRARDGFLITVLFWIVLAVFGALPFMLSDATRLSLTDAFFESVSGLTTTGATVLSNLDELPRSLLYYRQQLHWLGGIGIAVIAVAILPMLGVGGMQVYRAETPGPMKDSKLTPRVTGTAKALFLIYLCLTLVCGFAYWAGGMSVFDAVGHAYATVSIGGFSTHDASFGYYDNPTILFIAMVFMVLSGINFALHFVAWHGRGLRHYLTDPECRFYLRVLLAGSLVTAAALYLTDTLGLADSLVHGSFALVSTLTTTGFSSTEYTVWPKALLVFIFLTALMGACAGSTGGGLKVIRVLLIIKQGLREVRRLIHPNAIQPLKLGQRTVSQRVVEAVWGFFAVYLALYLLLLLLLLHTGLDFSTAFTAVGACLNNLGPGMGEVVVPYADISASAKWVLSVAMLLGRLEIFTLLILFTPMFWQR